MSSAFAHRDFTLLQVGRFTGTIGIQTVSVSVGYLVYERTHDPKLLGYVGLVQFLPMLVCALIAGQVSDRVDRRRILTACYAAFAAGAAVLAWAAQSASAPLTWIYVVLAALGVTRSFAGPAASALLPEVVPREDFPSAVAWSSSVWQVASIVGPTVAGFAYPLLHAHGTFLVAAAALAVTVGCLLAMRVRSRERTKEPVTITTLFAGLRYVFAERVLLGAISLDLFAVLLGGAVALLPAVATDVLHAGPVAFGVLRSAPAVGAAAMATILARHAVRRRAGLVMFGGVACFGLATIVFGLSRTLPLSVAALVAVGAADMLSVYVRQNIIQAATPDEMRGRVSAVSFVFIGASNELGEFESGMTASWFGTERAIVLGGIGTMLVVGLWAWLFPTLRRADDVLSPRSESANTSGG